MKRAQQFTPLKLGLWWLCLFAGCASKPAEQALTPPPVAPAVTPPAAHAVTASAVPVAASSNLDRLPPIG
ncbi:MAG: hypothetical protein WDO74_00645 [Pseudomonadota bacterium]